MTLRIKKLIDVCVSRDIDAFLVTKDVNIAYLTGFPASESWLFVGRRRAVYITDFRYLLEAKKGLKGIGILRYTRSIYEAFSRLAADNGIKSVGIDERHLTVAQFRALKAACPKKCRLVKADGLVEGFREIKDANEIRKIRGALKVHHQAHRFLKTIIKPGVSERAVARKLENFVKSKGAGFSFAPIIASGPNSCYPHAKITDRRLRAGEPVLIDMGIDICGYKSDLTRMFFLGRIPPLVKQVNDAVDEAQRVAIGNIKDGVPVADIDALARNCLAKEGLAKYFGHALGHGVGLEIHEDPRLASGYSSVLRKGMVVTVEPAVYIPGKFGIRIEDMVLVAKENCERLSDNIY